MGKISMKDLSDTLAQEEIKEIDEAYKKPIVYDEDSPEMTADMLRQFHRFDEVPVYISDTNRATVKSFGSKYREILSKLINMALNDRDMVKKCL